MPSKHSNREIIPKLGVLTVAGVQEDFEIFPREFEKYSHKKSKTTEIYINFLYGGNDVERVEWSEKQRKAQRAAGTPK